MNSRDRILAAVRSATHDAVDVAPVRDHHRELSEQETDGRDLIELFAERVDDYRAEVHVVDRAELPLRIGQVLGQRRVRSLVVPHDVDARWLSTTHARLVRDDADVSTRQLAEVDAVVTGCAAAIAITGTIVLDSGPRQGRRAITLLPDLHLCVVEASAIVGSVPEAVRRLDGSRPLTWISGPSATSDIELDRVEGVHGPRNLVVLVVR